MTIDATRLRVAEAAHLNGLVAGEATDLATLTVRAEPVGVGAPIGDVLHRLDNGADAIPVAGPDSALVGWARHREALAALSRTPT